jgi:hypothetical protein
MRYTVSGRPQSIITAALAILLAAGMHLGAAGRSDALASAETPAPQSLEQHG